MKLVTVYTTDSCSHCVSAKMLLDKYGVSYDVINLSRDPDSREELVEKTGMFTFPQILIDGEPLGGFDQLLAAHRAGRLAELLAEPSQAA
jgi:glutaredoxin 3